MEYHPTIGLEIHAELKTRTKMFCDCRNDLDEKHPNINVCPICLGHPGTLPTINQDAVVAALKVGLALRGTVTPLAKFDRKNYFYPDLPKGYQISQYDAPLIAGGEIKLRQTGALIRIRRLHLEEDTGRLLHFSNGAGIDVSLADKASKNNSSLSQKDLKGTLVDFNRAGVPLIELVTEPDFKNAEEVVEFAQYFQLILRYLRVSDADMEKGQLRVEANVSLGQWIRGVFREGRKVELKNLNSFRAVYDAIKFELRRQEEILRSGEKVVQETRGWNEAKQETISQRAKEEAHDYRYFPEPDLPFFETKIFDLEALRAEIPELPYEKLERFMKEYALSEAQAWMLVKELPLADFYEAAASELEYRNQSVPHSDKRTPVKNYIEEARRLLFNYLTSDLRGLMSEMDISWEELKITPEHLAHLVDLIVHGDIMSRGAKDILRKMAESGLDPEEILEQEGLYVVSEEAELHRVVEEVIEENPQAAEDYKKGKEASIQFLIGKAMAKLKGRGNPEKLRALFQQYRS